MPGTYGRTVHIVGEVSTPKAAAGGNCAVCRHFTYRHIYLLGQGWVYRDRSCDPVKAIVERRYARSDKGADYVPMGYVPSNYPIERGIAVDPDGTTREFRPKRRASE